MVERSAGHYFGKSRPSAVAGGARKRVRQRASFFQRKPNHVVPLPQSTLFTARLRKAALAPLLATIFSILGRCASQLSAEQSLKQ